MPTITKANFLTWFQNTGVLEIEKDTLKVGVPSNYLETWLSQKYGIKILQAAQEINPEIKKVEYIVETALMNPGDIRAVDIRPIVAAVNEKKVRKVKNLNEVTMMSGANGEKILSQMMNNRYKLDNFVVGFDNRLPHAASAAVSKVPGGIYNPLYIYGKVGLGKTHLVQAIGNEILRNFPNKIVKYITAERFVSEVVEAIGKRHMQSFKDRYRKVDVFLVDDVQFFARKDSSQQEFFHTFNELYDANKQIVLTSDRAPAELDGLEERLKSRFAMGMVVELLCPDFETRLAILQQKCRESQMIIDSEVLNFVATNVQSNVRELEGVLKQILAETQLFNLVPTIRSAAEVIKRMNKAHQIIGYDIEAKQNFIARSSQDVMKVVSEHFNVTIEQLISEDRHSDLMLPRHVCMYLIKNELGESYEKIGLGFGGRNHTTVMHACNKTAKKLRTDIRLVRDINAIKREMGL